MPVRYNRHKWGIFKLYAFDASSFPAASQAACASASGASLAMMPSASIISAPAPVICSTQLRIHSPSPQP